MTGRLPVVYAPLALQPDVGRVFLSLPEGMTIEEIVGEVLADAPEPVLDRIVVTMVNGKSSARVPRKVWHRVRPFAGTQIVIMIAPGRSALNLLLSIAAIAISAFVFPAGAAGIFGLGLQGSRALLTFGITALGGLLLNALFPVKKEKEERPTYAVTGWANEIRPNAPVGRVYGEVRYAPPLGAFSYLEVVGDILYNRVVVSWGLGPVEVSDLKNGETPLTKYDEIEIEHRYGYDDDEPLTLYTQQVIEEKIGTDLVREFQRDDAGNPLPGDWLAPVDEKPVERTTARDCAYAIVILSFPSGLGYINSKNKKIWNAIRIGVRIKKEPDGVWETKPDIIIRAKKFAGFFREVRFDFAERGAYTIELTRKSPSEQPEDDVGTYVMLCTWAVLQSFRPEYPFNFDKPHAMSAIRVKSTYQLSGGLDALNGLIKGIMPDWNGVEWVDRTTKNPASHALDALRGPGLYRPVPDAKIDFAFFQEWHEFCTEKGLTYNRVHDFESSLGETLATIGAAGRASVRWDGRRWTGTIDRPREIPVDHITPRNSSGLKAAARYFEPPHAFRVPFNDETNEYRPAERIVPWPGHVGPIDITETLDLPGITDPDRIWIEARRRQYEALHRATTYSATMFGMVRTATVGDLVLGSQDILKRAMASARVVAVRDGNQITIDEVWTAQEGIGYVIRFRQFDVNDTIGTSIVRSISAPTGEFNTFRLTGTGQVPAVGDLLLFGPAGSESKRLIVTEIERGKDNTSILSMLPEAAIIDELTDAEVPPEWIGRVGEDVGSDIAPDTPIVENVSTMRDDHGYVTAGTVLVGLRPAVESARVSSYEVDHRLVGAGSFTTATGRVGEGGVGLTGYATDDHIEFRARALSPGGLPSAYTALIDYYVGQEIEVPPPAATFDAVRMANSLWRYSWTVGTVETWQIADEVVGAHLRYKVGAWGSWDDLDDVAVGIATTSPWDASTPIADGFYTFGIKLVGASGAESAPVLIYAVAPDAALSILTDDDAFVLADDDADIIIEDA